jgi:hypothetical protein
LVRFFRSLAKVDFAYFVPLSGNTVSASAKRASAKEAAERWSGRTEAHRNRLFSGGTSAAQENPIETGPLA